MSHVEQDTPLGRLDRFVTRWRRRPVLMQREDLIQSTGRGRLKSDLTASDLETAVHALSQIVIWHEQTADKTLHQVTAASMWHEVGSILAEVTS